MLTEIQLNQLRSLQYQAARLLIYQSVLERAIGQTFLNLLETLLAGHHPLGCLQAYGNWFSALAEGQQTWQDYLLEGILRSPNGFSQKAQSVDFTELSPCLIEAAQHDLQRLQFLYHCPGKDLTAWVQTVTQLPTPPILWQESQQWQSSDTAIVDAFQQSQDWGQLVPLLADYYRQAGMGVMATYRAFRWQAGHLVGIAHPDPVQLHELVGYEAQREMLVKNTEFLLTGYRSLNILLYGSRGSGKSSLVKALLQEYGDRGLRLIEVAKSDLRDLSDILEQLRNLPQKFIIFVDDLSFEEDESAFKALKVVLEGSVTARPANVVVYATSNRRHLIREFFADRPRPKDQDEIHAWDTIQEKLSFSDRFGLTLTFEPADQDTYLAIVSALAAQAGLSISQPDLEYRALQWATRQNGRSGRTARQFIDFLVADLALNL